MITNLRPIAFILGLIVLQSCGGGSSATSPNPRSLGPAIQGFNPSSVEAGDQVTVQISGSGFQPGATSDSGQGITVNLTEFVSNSQLDAHLTISPDATEGLRPVSVRNSDGRTGGNSTGFSVKSPAPVRTGNLILNIGDAPVGNLLSLSVTIKTVELSDLSFLGSSSLTVTDTPLRVEVSRLAGTAMPVIVATIPDSSFCTLNVKFASPEVTYLEPGGTVKRVAATLVNDTVPLNLGCSLDVPINLVGLTFTSIPTIITLDFDVGSSLTLSGGGPIEVNPILGRRITLVGSENPPHYWSGAIESLSGVVTGVVGERFAVAASSGASFSFLTDGNTTFDGLAGIEELRKGAIVQVDATAGADGQFTARGVKLEEGSTQGLESRGIVTSVTGAPATQLTMVVQDSISPTSATPATGSALIGALSGAAFEQEKGPVDLTNLTFAPTFDASTIFPGQSVIVDTDQPGVSPLPAQRVRLAEQALRGAIANLATNGGQTTFTLNLDPGSAFTTLTGAGSLEVIQQPETLVVADYSQAPSVIARGLVFKTDTGYALVASAISP